MNFKQFISSVSAFAVASSVFAGFAVTVSAADVTTDTLTPAADTEIRRWSGEDSLSVNADLSEKVQLVPNNSAATFTSNDWRSSVLMRFGKTEKQGTITKATLKFYYNANTSKSDTLFVYSTSKADWDAASTTWMTEMTADAKNATWKGTNAGSLSEQSVSLEVPTNNNGWKEFDVTSILQPTENGYSFMISTSGTKGGSIESMETQLADAGVSRKPQLILELSDTASVAYYKLVYVDKEGNPIGKDAVTGNCDISAGYTLSEGDKAVYRTTDGKKYIYDTDNESNTDHYEVTSQDPDNPTEIKLYYKEDAKYTYTINATGDVVKTLKTAELYEGDKQNVYYPRYIQDEHDTSIIYEGAKQNDAPHYGKYVQEAGSLDVNYQKKYENVVYFEDFDDAMDNGVSQNYQASNGGVRNNSAWSTTLNKGTYKILAYVCNRSRGSSITVGDTELKKVSEVADAQAYGMIEETFTVNEDSTEISLSKGGGNTYDPIDTVIIIDLTPKPKEYTVDKVETYNGDSDGSVATLFKGTISNITGTITGVKIDGEDATEKITAGKDTVLTDTTAVIAVIVNKSANEATLSVTLN